MASVENRPLIAVTGPFKRFPISWWATRFMLSLCGLRGIYLTAHTSMPAQEIHGIIIGGGDDIDPIHYGAESEQEKYYDKERDLFEMQMIRRALKDNIPMLGICRGAQLINVVSQGSLYQDIKPLRKKTPNKRTLWPLKWVELEPGRIKDHLSIERIKVNSLHDQAIKDVGGGLTVVGRDADGFVQAIEGNYGFLLGVQWHPEYMPYNKYQRALFDLFAHAVHDTERVLTLDSMAKK